MTVPPPPGFGKWLRVRPQQKQVFEGRPPPESPQRVERGLLELSENRKTSTRF